MDIACKYFPYLQKVTKEFPDLQTILDMKPLLSVMHAKAHTWKCEVTGHVVLVTANLSQHPFLTFVKQTFHQTL